MRVARADATPSPNIAGARVLVVDDDDINQQVAREILTNAGVVVGIAGSGPEALVELDAREYDAVLMDVEMPGMNGYEATAGIRKTGATLPIIAMTAHREQGFREVCLAAGMNDFVSKPIEQATLFTVLAAWVAPRGTASLETRREAAFAETVSDYPGFDFAAGLRRLEGNRGLLLRLMADFARDYADATERIRHAAEAADWDVARRLAHTVRGAAGNLSATELFEVAGHVEHAAATRDIAATRDALAALEIALVVPIRTGAAVRAANEANQREVELRDAASADVTEDVIQRAKAILDTLTTLLERHDPKAEPMLAELRRLLRPTKFDGALVIAANGLASYDFRAAAKALRTLREELDLVIAPS